MYILMSDIFVKLQQHWISNENYFLESFHPREKCIGIPTMAPPSKVIKPGQIGAIRKGQKSYFGECTTNCYAVRYLLYLLHMW